MSNANSWVSVRLLKPHDIPLLVAAFDAQGWHKPTFLFESYILESASGVRTILVAQVQASIAGYLTIKWRPTYAYFQEADIPELSDLNVLKKYQKSGVARALMEAAEALVFNTRPRVGLGVGLFKDYGPAQRLYIKRGYMPDGRGLTYQEKPCHNGDQVRVDDDLVLWLVKEK